MKRYSASLSITEHHCYKTPPHTYSHGYQQKGENNQVGKHVEKLEPSASPGWGWYKEAHSLWEMGYYCQLDLESLGEAPLGTPMRDYFRLQLGSGLACGALS